MAVNTNHAVSSMFKVLARDELHFITEARCEICPMETLRTPSGVTIGMMARHLKEDCRPILEELEKKSFENVYHLLRKNFFKHLSSEDRTELESTFTTTLKGSVADAKRNIQLLAGMMPMGLNLMVPPPMLAMPGSRMYAWPGFHGMATLAGMPNMPMMGQMRMGMVPPGMPNPPAQHQHQLQHPHQRQSHPGLDALRSILSNPEILRQLQTLQEQIAAAEAVQQHQQMVSNYANTPEQERQLKLAELSKQEAAFDQRLAETVARLPFAKECDLPTADDSTPKRGDVGGSSSSPHFSRDHRHGVDQNSNQLSNHTNPNVLLPPPFFQHLSEQTQQQQNSQQLLHLFRNKGGAGGSNSSQNPFSLRLPFPIQGVPPPFPPGQQQDVPQNMGLFSTQPPGMNSFSTPFSQQPPPHLNNNQNQITINNKSISVEEIDLCDDTKEEDPLQIQLQEQQRSGDLQRGRSKRSRFHERHNSGGSRAGSRTRRSRSRSRDRGRKRYRSRSRESREESENEKERLRKGLPIIKKEHLSVFSTTLWVGHLSKLVSQEEISDTFGAYGDVVSIDLIPPRGCALIVMNRRQDAVRALDRLKTTKLQGKSITLAWAPGEGVKGKEWKDYWEVADGISYIPWNKLRDETNLEEFEDGGCMDEDTLPDFLKNKPQPPESESMDQNPPLPADNENSEDSMAMLNPPLPSQNAPTQMQGLLGNQSGGGIPSLLDPSALAAVGGKPSDTDAIGEGGVPPPNPVAPPMPPGPFGMGPSVGMMPMGLNLMAPPPLLAIPGFQGMATLPGTRMMGQIGMGMVPPGMPNPHAQQHQHQLQHPHQHQPHPGMGAPGLLGEIPVAGPPPPNMALAIQLQQQQMQQQQQQQTQIQNNNNSLNNSLNSEESSSSDLITEEVKPERGGRTKKRSRGVGQFKSEGVGLTNISDRKLFRPMNLVKEARECAVSLDFQNSNAVHACFKLVFDHISHSNGGLANTDEMLFPNKSNLEQFFNKFFNYPNEKHAPCRISCDIQVSTNEHVFYGNKDSYLFVRYLNFVYEEVLRAVTNQTESEPFTNNGQTAVNDKFAEYIRVLNERLKRDLSDNPMNDDEMFKMNHNAFMRFNWLLKEVSTRLKSLTQEEHKRIFQLYQNMNFDEKSESSDTKGDHYFEAAKRILYKQDLYKISKCHNGVINLKVIPRWATPTSMRDLRQSIQK